MASVLDYISKKSNSRDFQGDIKTANIPAKRKKSLGKVENKKVKEGRKIEANLQSYISAGILHEEAVSKISSLSETDRYKALHDMVLQGSRSKKASFTGQVFEGHTPKKTSSQEKSAKEIQGDRVSSWIRQKMAEGTVEKKLDALIELKYSSKVIKDQHERIASARAEHEGLSGHVYVDADSYMSKGAEGCDKGGFDTPSEPDTYIVKN